MNENNQNNQNEKKSKRPDMWAKKKTYTPPTSKEKTKNYTLQTILLAAILGAAIYVIFFTDVFKTKKEEEPEYDSTVIPKFKYLSENEYDKSYKKSSEDYMVYEGDKEMLLKVTYEVPENFTETVTPAKVTLTYNADSTCEISFGQIVKIDPEDIKPDKKISASSYAYSYASNKKILKDLGKANIDNIDWYITIEKDSSGRTIYNHFGLISDELYYVTFKGAQNKSNEEKCNKGYQYFIQSFIKK